MNINNFVNFEKIVRESYQNAQNRGWLDGSKEVVVWKYISKIREELDEVEESLDVFVDSSFCIVEHYMNRDKNVFISDHHKRVKSTFPDEISDVLIVSSGLARNLGWDISSEVSQLITYSFDIADLLHDYISKEKIFEKVYSRFNFMKLEFSKRTFLSFLKYLLILYHFNMYDDKYKFSTLFYYVSSKQIYNKKRSDHGPTKI